MGSLGCGSGRIVTVRILELITAGGLLRHSFFYFYLFCFLDKCWCTFKMELNGLYDFGERPKIIHTNTNK